MAKKKIASKSKAPKKVGHRHFRPSYDAHPVMHLLAALVIIFLLALILSYIIFALQNPWLFA